MSVKTMLIFLFFAVVLLFPDETQSFKYRHFHTVSSRNCPEYDKSTLTVSVENFEIKTYNFGQRVITEVTYSVKKEIDNLKIIAELSECNNTKSTTCEVFLKKATVAEICELIEMEDTAWAALLATVTPKLTGCPIEEGIYVSTYESKKTEMIEFSAWLSDGLWRNKNLLYSGDELVGCWESDMEIYTPEHHT